MNSSHASSWIGALVHHAVRSGSWYSQQLIGQLIGLRCSNSQDPILLLQFVVRVLVVSTEVQPFLEPWEAAAPS